MNLPVAFSDYTRSLLGNDAYDKLVDALNASQPVSIRLNNKIEAVETAYLDKKVAWCDSGRYLDKRFTFTFDPLFHGGCYYVQEASSMFVEQVIRQYVKDAARVLDLCAAPGGKSTHLRSILPTGSLLVCNEVLYTRAMVLAENMMKWGDADVIVTNNAATDFASVRGMFDVMLTDMPCSGEGMFRKEEQAIKEWSSENVQMCSKRQREILRDCWDCLRPGGLLIYSTCTYNLHENEENVQWIIEEYGAEPLGVEMSEDWGVTGNLLPGASFPVYRFLPSRVRGEGFFMAVLRKKGDVESAGLKKRDRDKEGKKKNMSIAGIRDLMSCANSWITDNECYRLSTDGKIITAFKKENAEILDKLSKRLKVMCSGVTVGEIKGKDLLPTQSLALSKLFRKEVFPSKEVDYSEAIAYLRKEPIVLDSETPRGFVLLTFRHIPLGFVKNVGNRANNLYPAEWRIRSSYMPEEVRTLI